MSERNELFCSVKAGVNTCEICCNEAYFSTTIPQSPHNIHPPMELFRCGHGVCETCLEGIMRRGTFKCPFCRSEGAQIANFDYVISCSLEARGLLRANERIPSPVKRINTFSEFLEEWEYTHHSMLNMNHRFMLLHKQIIDTEKQRLLMAKRKALKDREIALKEEKKRKRESSRKNAVCPVCNKNTFTSMKQLEQHMNAKHSKHSKKAKQSKR